GMECIVFSGKRLRQIGVTFPITIRVSVREPRVSDGVRAVVARYAAMWQRITVGVADHFRSRHRTTGEIPVACGIAPGSLRVPMPRFDVEFRVLAIGES